MSKLKTYIPLLLDTLIFIWAFFRTDYFLSNIVLYGVFFYFFIIIYFIFLRKRDYYNLFRVEFWETFLYISSAVILIVNYSIISNILDKETILLILNSSFAGLPPFVLFLRVRAFILNFKKNKS